MDQSQQYVQDLQKLFHASRDVLLTTRANARLDGLCALLALGKSFESMPLTTLTGPGQQRKVVKAVSGRQGTQYTSLVSSDTIVSELGLRDFVIGLPNYVENSVDSVSWYVDQGRLHLVLKSNPAVPMQFDPKLFDPFYAGANFDVVCVIDADTPADLGPLYRQDPGMFTELPVVNISVSGTNSRFGRINVVDTNVSSVSELVYEMLNSLQVHMDSDCARLLLAGIEDGTEFLTQKVSTRTQEIVEQLRTLVPIPLDVHQMRTQAQAQPMPTHPQGVLTQSSASFPQPGVMPPSAQGYGMPTPQGYQQVPPGYAPYGIPQQMYGMPTTYPPQVNMPQYSQTMPGYNPVQVQPNLGQQPGVQQMPSGSQQAPSTTIQAPSAFSQFHAPTQPQPMGYQPYNPSGYQPNQWNNPPQPPVPPGVQGYNDYNNGGGEGSNRS